MTGDEANKKWEAEKAELMKELVALSADTKRDLIKAASEYRSGSDSCNSVYMGGMAQSMLWRAIGPAGLTGASEKQLNAGLSVCASYIKYMREHPTKKCPCCGQIVHAKVGSATTSSGRE